MAVLINTKIFKRNLLKNFYQIFHKNVNDCNKIQRGYPQSPSDEGVRVSSTCAGAMTNYRKWLRL